MTSEDEKQFIREETGIESAEFIRTPDGRNVTRKVIREDESNDET